MNIIHFSDTYYPNLNGVVVAVEQFAKRAAAAGHKVILFVPACSLKKTVEHHENLTIYRIRSIPFPIYPGVQAALPNLARMFTQIREFKPDIVHIHTPAVLGVLGIIFAQILSVKIVNTYHTLFSMGTAYLSPKRLIPGAKIQVASNEEGLLSLIAWKLQVIFFNLSDLVIAPTKIIEKTIKKQGVKARIFTLPSGLDLSQFPQKKIGTLRYKIIHLGRLGFEKATDIIIKAFGQIKEKYPQATLTIAGDGPDRKNLEKLAVSLGLRDSVTFLGMVPHEKVSALYREHDVFMTASPFETQGLVLNEAMLSGLPVIAAAVYAPREIVKEGKNGYLFAEGNIEDCVKKTILLFRDPKKFSTLAKNARKSAEAFDSILLTNKLLTTYQKLAHKK